MKSWTSRSSSEGVPLRVRLAAAASRVRLTRESSAGAHEVVGAAMVDASDSRALDGSRTTLRESLAAPRRSCRCSASAVEGAAVDGDQGGISGARKAPASIISWRRVSLSLSRPLSLREHHGAPTASMLGLPRRWFDSSNLQAGGHPLAPPFGDIFRTHGASCVPH